MENMKVQNYGTDKMVQFDNCDFETGIVVSTGDLKKGAILTRGDDGNFNVWDGSAGEPVAVYVDDNEDQAGNIPCRALISGKVHKELIYVVDAVPTAAQFDALKAAGIVALPSTELNGFDNQ